MNLTNELDFLNAISLHLMPLRYVCDLRFGCVCERTGMVEVL